MKTLMSLFVAGFAFSSVCADAAEYQFVATDNSVETRLCIAVTANDVKQLKRVLRRHKERLVDMRDSVNCNGIPIADFAEQYGFNLIARYINDDKSRVLVASAR